MESVIRAAVIYFFLLVILRASGRRTFSEMTTFDFVLLLIISEAIQQGMMADDNSMINSFLVVITIVAINILLAWIKARWNTVDNIISGVPMIVVDQGKVLHQRMKKARIDEKDIMESARDHEGIERMDQIKYAILEKNGKITIIAK